MSTRRLLIAWSYLSEIILAALVTALFRYSVDESRMIDFIHQSAIDLATLFCAISFGGALAFLWTFYSKTDTKFYVWLDGNGAAAVYVNATAYTIFIEAAATLVLTSVKYVKDGWVAFFGIFLFFLAVINSYTLVINVKHMMRLQIAYARRSGGD